MNYYFSDKWKKYDKKKYLNFLFAGFYFSGFPPPSKDMTVRCKPRLSAIDSWDKVLPVKVF